MKRWIVLVMALLEPLIGFAQAPKTPAPRLEVVQVLVSDTIVGNINGILEPGETAAFGIRVYNAGTATARDVYGALYSTEPGVTISQRNTYFGDILPGETVLSQNPQCQVTVSNSVVCGKDLGFQLQLLGDNTNETNVLLHPMTKTPQRDLAEFAEDMTIYGAQSGDHFGQAVSIGDFNGDGIGDIIIGAPWADSKDDGRPDAGEVWVVYGSLHPTATVDLANPGGLQHTLIYGIDATYDLTGNAVSSGDVNGDGYDDIIIGAYYSSGPSNGRNQSGEVRVVFGSPDPGTEIDLANPPANSTSVIYGAQADDFAGYCVSSGDINGDGFDDLIMGAPGADGPADGREAAGEVWIIYGQSTWPTSMDLAYSPVGTTVIYNPDPYDPVNALESEYVYLSSGDINGDDYDDVIIGLPNSSGLLNVVQGAGEVWIVYGGAFPIPVVDLASPAIGTFAVIYGLDKNDSLGTSVASGDFNGDGLDDVLMGAYYSRGADNQTVSAGEVWMIPGSASPLGIIRLSDPPTNSCVIYGADITDCLGISVTSGDLNGDGYADMVLGARLSESLSNSRMEAGEFWIIEGADQLPSVIDLATPPSDSVVIYGRDSDDEWGLSLSADDINGDGLDDIVACTSKTRGPANGGSNVGEAAVFLGRPSRQYFLDPDSYSWIDATGGTEIGLACDTCCEEVAIGFPFEFYGREVTSAWICDDGYLSFSEVVDPFPFSFCPPDIKTPNNLIAAFWDDLNPGAGGNVYTLLEGAEPNRRLTIEWSGVPYYPNTGNATFEITLFESTDQILVQYQDTTFGNSADDGATASAGVENSTGINGKSFSCQETNLTANSAWRAVPFGSYPIFSDDMESGLNGWITSGTDSLWHQEATYCSPNSRSPSTSWYYGRDDGSCDYYNGTFDPTLASWGLLSSPQIDVDYYGNVYQFMRNEVEGDPYDQSFLQVKEDGGVFFDVEEIFFDDPDNWYSWRSDISDSSGHAINVGYYVSQDDSVYGFLGWMVDDVEVWGCDVYGAKVMNALAYARPAPVCETQTYLLDGTGTFAQGCQGLTYQWHEDGGPMGGATTLQHTVPSDHATGLYAYTLQATCANPVQTVTSDPVSVRVVPMPPEVPEDSFKLKKINDGDDIHLTWADVAGGDAYTVYQDTAAGGSFGTEAGQAPTGPAGLDIAMPSGDLVFYLVAGANDTCGAGPKR